MLTVVSGAAIRPDPAAKEAAWTAALASRPGGRVARAHAEGVWVRGQEGLMAGYRDRYFGEALPNLNLRDARGDRPARRLARLLFPATLDDADTLAAVRAALNRGDLTEHFRDILLQQEAELLHDRPPSPVFRGRQRPPKLSEVSEPSHNGEVYLKVL